ncbi:MAG: Carnitine dehydratase [Actinomycetia bacterium]|nr:Carnitine dehydratase [Actinomycetes bacterium]
MCAYSGILTALYVRATTGVARAVEVSLFEALAEWMGQPAYYTRYGGTQPPRIGTHHATIAPYGAYTAADSKQVLFSIQNEREWAALCERFLQRPELVDDPRFATGSDRVVHRDELNVIVAERFWRSDGAEVLKLLNDAGIANAGVNDVREFLDHPVLAERGRWHEVGIPGAVVQALRPPVDLAGIDPRMDRVPAVGEHTERILTELGQTAAEIEALRADGVI